MLIKPTSFTARLAFLFLPFMSGVISVPVPLRAANPGPAAKGTAVAAKPAAKKQGRVRFLPKDFPNPDIDGAVMKPDGSPFAGARVTWGMQEPDGSKPLVAVTDDRGRFHFDGKTAWAIDTATGAVIVEADGFALAVGHVRFDADLAHPTPIAVTLTPSSAARIRLLDPLGKPAAGVAVHISSLIDPHEQGNYTTLPPGLPAASAVSGADGTVTFPALPRGWDVRLEVDSPQFAQIQYPEKNKKVANAPATDWPDVKLVAAASIDGVIIAPDGRPVADARVEAHSDDQIEKFAFTNTDENGHFSLKQMASGQYRVSSYLGGEWSNDWAALDASVTLTPGTHKTGVKLAVVKAAIITGHVFLKDGGKFTESMGVGVSVERRGGDKIYSAESTLIGPKGDYRFCMTPGNIKVSIYGAGLSVEDQQTVAKEGETKTINFTIAPPAPPSIVNGIVTDQDGKPVADARVTCDTVNYQSSQPEAVSGPDGKFSLSIQNSPMIYVRARKGNAVTLKDTAAVNGDNITLKLQDNALATITGKVVDTDGKPIAGASVTPIEWHGRSGDNLDAATTDANGVYQAVNLPPGYRYSLSTSATGFANLYTESLFPQTAQTLPADNIVLKRTDSFVGGRVIDSHGFPLAGAEVTPNNDRDKHTTTDKQGKFHIDGVAPGDIVLEVKKGDEWMNMQVAAGKEDNLIKTYSQSAQQKQMNNQPKPMDYVGKYAPEFNVDKWVNVSPVIMSDLKGKIIIFDMWGCCSDQLYETQQMAQQFANRGVVAIGLNVSGSSLKEVQEHIVKEKLTLPIAIDKDTAKGLGGTGFEEYSLVGRDGKVAYAGFDSNEMMTALGKLLAQK